MPSRAARGAALACLLLLGGNGVARAQSLQVGDVHGAAGCPVSVPVMFSTANSGATGLAVDLGFDTGTPVATSGGAPACTFSSTVQRVKEDSAVAFRPPGCTPGVNCNGVRAGIISLNQTNNATSVPGGTLYNCLFPIPSNASVGATFRLNVVRSSFIKPDASGREITDVASGTVTVDQGALGGNTSCVGDCSGLDGVTGSELLVALDVLLGVRDPSDCPAYACGVSGATLLQALDNLLLGCVG